MRAMRVVKCCLLIISLMLTVLPAPLKAQGRQQSVGLVLSGGGAKGIAHVGLIKALEDNDIPIDFITGTSMGAIVGGLYACGYTPEQMMELFKSRYFNYMAVGKADPAFTYYFASQPATPQMFGMAVGRTDSAATASFFNPQSLISPTAMDFGFMQIFAPYTALCRGNYNNLFVPLRVVASDVNAKRKKVMGSGRLEESIRASMSFPLVFQATKIGNEVLYDGGIYDNFPVDVMQSDFAPDIMIGSDVSTPDKGPANSYFDQLDLLVSRKQSYEVPSEKGIKIHIDVSRFSLLDWDKAQAIYQVGYDRGMQMIDSIKERVHSRIPAKTVAMRRSVFRSRTPELRFDSVSVQGGTPRQNEFVRSLFRPAHGNDTIGIDRARLAFYRTLSTGRMDLLRARTHCTNDSAGLFALDIEAHAKSHYTVGAGAYITSSNNSYIYLRGGYASLTSLSADIEAYIGQSYMAGAFTGSLAFSSRAPSALRLQIVAQRRKYYQNEKLFFRDDSPSFVTNHQYYTKLSWNVAAGRTGLADIGIGAAKLRSTYYASVIESDPAKHHVDYVLGQAYAGYETSSLNSLNYPTSGHMLRVTAAGLLGSATVRQTGFEPHKHLAWMQVDASERFYIDIHRKWSLGLESRVLLSTRPLLAAYDASISSAPGYAPTPASTTVFNPALHANSFVAASLVPVYKFNSSFSARLLASAILPVRRILPLADGSAHYGHYFGASCFFGEFNLVYSLPFGDIAAYCNYVSKPGKANVGISLGIYLPEPNFIK